MGRRNMRAFTHVPATLIVSIAAASAFALAPSAAQARNGAGTPPLTWSAPKFVEQPPFQNGLGISAISCATATQCVATDGVGAVLVSAHPAGGWSAWRTTRVSLPGGFGQPLSCVHGSPILCITANGYDIVTSTDPGGGAAAWHEAPVPVAVITCQSASLCVGAGFGTILTSTNPTGGAPAWQTFHINAGRITAMSCPTSSFCAAVDKQGSVLTSTNPTGGRSAWQVTEIESGGQLLGISCPTASLCVASDATGNVLTTTNPTGGASAWTKAAVANSVSIFRLDCASATSCVGITHNGRDGLVASSNPTGGSSAWHVFGVAGSRIAEGVSCPTATLCVGADSAGDVISSSLPTSGASAWHTAKVDAFTPIASISCPTTRFCAAAFGHDIVTSSDPAAQKWHLTSLRRALRSISTISCPESTFCVAGGSGGVATSARPAGGPSAWHGARLDAGAMFTALACPSLRLCVAADDHHRIFYSANPAGGRSAWRSFSFDPKGTIGDLSCPSTAICTGLDSSDVFVTAVRPARGRAAWFISSRDGGLIMGLTCASASFCIASGSPATFFTFHPSRGASAWKHAGSNLYAQVMACPSTSLCVGGVGGGITFSTNPTGSGNNVWSGVQVSSNSGAMPAIACGGITLCVAGDSFGELIVGT